MIFGASQLAQFMDRLGLSPAAMSATGTCSDQGTVQPGCLACVVLPLPKRPSLFHPLSLTVSLSGTGFLLDPPGAAHTTSLGTTSNRTSLTRFLSLCHLRFRKELVAAPGAIGLF